VHGTTGVWALVFRLLQRSSLDFSVLQQKKFDMKDNFHCLKLVIHFFLKIPVCVDFEGVRQHLDHLVHLGIDAVLLSSVFDSTIENFGRDVIDFKSVNAEYGTLQDLDNLIAELHERGK
jgi:microsomal dipeptidase-like Zn-dependent dipeptidase